MSTDIENVIEGHLHGQVPATEQPAQGPVEESLEVRIHGMKIDRQAALNEALGLRP